MAVSEAEDKNSNFNIRARNNICDSIIDTILEGICLFFYVTREISFLFVIFLTGIKNIMPTMRSEYFNTEKSNAKFNIIAVTATNISFFLVVYMYFFNVYICHNLLSNKNFLWLLLSKIVIFVVVGFISLIPVNEILESRIWYLLGNLAIFAYLYLFTQSAYTYHLDFALFILLNIYFNLFAIYFKEQKFNFIITWFNILISFMSILLVSMFPIAQKSINCNLIK
ncbi:hypothetical protein H312_02392 [Anncaliia algerae PRA339]|uniref:Uncharacterized protein n=1 Tax=Anncaliia algerae PRA339 TaxID=1288291 RepID=A0A059EZB7_9MICR|nr:hypothetical protein H312_02392 [Anncaliia algerae PRA339]